MLEPCTTCGEATERGTCAECRQAERSMHKTARAQSILGVLNTPGEPRYAWGGDVTPFEPAMGGPIHLDDPLPVIRIDPAVDGPIITADQVKHLGTDWIDKAYQQQRRD
jgi:hypothetical protein